MTGLSSSGKAGDWLGCRLLTALRTEEGVAGADLNPPENKEEEEGSCKRKSPITIYLIVLDLILHFASWCKLILLSVLQLIVSL